MNLVPIACRIGVLFSLLAMTQSVSADVALQTGSTARFASAKEGAEILGREDDFTRRLSEFDRAARLKTDRPVSTADFLRFVRANVVEWTDAEKVIVETMIGGLRPKLEALALPLPATVSFIKTTGAEEGKAFYTRGTAVVIPEGELHGGKTQLSEKVIAHEVFHILSRENPALREALYRVIGFTKRVEATLPPDLRSRKITNPDAPRNDHSIRLQMDGKEVAAVPVLFSRTEKYDSARGGEFFDYLQFNFLISSSESKSASDLIVSPEKVSGFFEQIGRNTQYVIHPEEILAENFALLLLDDSKVPSPEILQRMRAVLTKPKR